MSLRSRRAGLTLMELVVALAVTGMAVSAGYAALAEMTDRQRVLERLSDEVQDASSVRSTLIDWLDGARIDPVRLGASFSGLDRRRNDLPDDVLTFLTGASTALEVARTSITLRIARDSSGAPLGLEALLRDWDGGRRRQLLLVPEVTSLEIRYLSAIPGELGWIPSWTTATLLPAAVELTMAGDADDALPRLLRTPILMPIATR